MTLNMQFGKIHTPDARRNRKSGLAATASMLAFAFLMSLANTLLADETRPNVVLIVIDDLGWADLGCYGSKFHKTPNLDRLAADGMRFTQAYAAAPVGSPTRAAIMTGRYPQRFGITTSVLGMVYDPSRRLKPPEVAPHLPLSEVTIAEALKPAGYVTASIGKWNLGAQGFGPKEQGFDVSVAGINVVSVPYRDEAPYTDKDGNTLPGLEQAPDGEFLTDRLAAEAEKFITDHKSKPFFLYLPHFAVHMPANPKPELVAKYGKMPTAPNGLQINPYYAAMIESMDNAVGRVLKTLDDLQLSQNTLVLLTSDNGGVCNANGQIIPPTSNAPLRDGMGHLYEGGLRVPLIAKWPGIVKAGSISDQIVSCLDFFPTIAEACGGSEKLAVLDGVSLIPLLKGVGQISREALYWHFPHYNVNAGAKPGGAIRAGDWKLIEYYETTPHDASGKAQAKADTGRRELFNVNKNGGEGQNFIDEKADIAKDLAAKLAKWRETVGAKLPTENLSYAPNLQADDGSVMIPSSTADVFGVMLRYEPLPNKDTIGYWVKKDDWASYEFTLTKPGRFHLVPHVGCGTNGGSLVHFEVAGQTLPLKVPGTGHFQNFVPQDLGIVTLDKPGRYTLTVKPQQLVGVAVMDVRRIELKPVTVAEMLPELHLLEPFWRSATVFRESVLCVEDGPNQPVTGKLLFPATKILAIHAANGQKQFQEGNDFTLALDGRQILRAERSSIPYLKGSDLFMPRGARPVWTGGAQPDIPCALPHKLGDPETHLLFDNGHWFHDQQIEVTYVRATNDWPGGGPKFDPTKLPKTLARLKAKQKLTIAVSGDSISYGLNASGLVGASPFMPMYPDLVAAQLRATYGGEVNLINRAVGGWGVPNGLADLDKLLESSPDLMIIAYGMNDVSRRNPDAYRDGIQQMITRIKAAQPQAETILVATMVGNEQWTHTPREMFPKYLEALRSLQGDGVNLADLTTLWTEMLKRKRDCDLTGNGVNHPSDFGHRVYASALLSLLIENP
jgi:arylsulfatase A